MALSDIRRQHVKKALAECKRLGDAELRKKYGFGEARSYLLLDAGRFFDSKAIVGAAHEVATGHPWGPSDFSGGEATVQRMLEKYGFRVLPTPFREWDFWGSLAETAASLDAEFSPWKRFAERKDLGESLAFVGVYLIAKAKRRPSRRVPPPKSLIYIGETSRTLGQRLEEFASSAGGRADHSGGRTYHSKYGSETSDLFVCVLPVRLPAEVQGDAVSLLERYLIWLYARRWGSSPKCNSK